MKNKHILLLCFLCFSYAYSQIPPNYYNGASGLNGEELKETLNNIITNMHNPVTYDYLRDVLLPYADEDPDNTDNVILIYTGWSSLKSNFGNNNDNWNREHIWAKSHGDFGNYPPEGTDAHHIRPCDVSVNTSRGNKDFDMGGTQHPEAILCKSDSDSWEPRDDVKGDVARMMFYMVTRYEGENGEADLELVDYTGTATSTGDGIHGKLSTLIEWHYQDMPDDFEIRRNNRIYEHQSNRNPFIDHPEYVNALFGTSLGFAENLENKIKIFPNPVHDTFYIQFLDKNILDKKYDLATYDFTGKQIQFQYKIFKNGFEVCTKNCKRGVYLIVLSSEGKTFITKIIKK